MTHFVNANNDPISISEKLKTIPSKDVFTLEKFFRNLFADGDIAHVLFGIKPGASCAHNFQLAFSKPKLWNKAVIDFTGWKVWQKYSHLFPMSKFCMIGVSSLKENLCFEIALYNKYLCKEIIEKNYELFNGLYGEKKTPDEILTSFSYTLALKNLPENYYIAMGLLYGYGKRNSEAFQKRMQSIDTISEIPIDVSKLNPNAQEGLTTSSFHPILTDTSHVVETLNALEEKFIFTKANRRLHPLCPIRIPGFVAYVDDPETIEVQEAYDSVLTELVSVYYSPRFLETILEKLTER